MNVDTPEAQGRVPGSGGFQAEIPFIRIILRSLQELCRQSGVVGFNKAEIGFPKIIQVQE
jgi:hypothetical protein